ncbi:MAG: protein kinase [Planctomycetes bacterium]|nr:protein kinase [Planctomycetota bacterium]
MTHDEREIEDGAHDDVTAHASEDELGEVLDAFLDDLFEGRRQSCEEASRGRPELGELYDLALRATDVPGRADRRFAGYEIVRELGRGGMGTVYLARHQGLDRPVALKVLPPAFAMSPRSRRRFLQEASTLAQIQDEHVVRIHRVLDEADTLAFEMEWVDGPSLRRVLDTLRPLGREATVGDLRDSLGTVDAEKLAPSLVQYFVQLAADIARALAKVHAQGLVHRDVKPSNILIRRDGCALLSDFGLIRDEQASGTRTVGFVGTPIYASPEQLRAAEDPETIVDARSDVYSLGITLYECLCGQPPFRGASASSVARRIAEGDVVPARRLAPQISRDLEVVVGKAIDPDPDGRYQSAIDFADDLQRLLRMEPIRARPASRLQRVVKLGRRHRRPLVAALLGAGVVFVVAIPLVLELLAGMRRPEDMRRLLADAQRSLLEVLAERPVPTTVGSSELVQRLEQVQRRYDAVLDLEASPEIAQERSVIALTRAVYARGLADFDRSAVESLPPATRATVWRVLRGVKAGDAFDARSLRSMGAEKTDRQDRWLLGLLMLLLGDRRIAHFVWESGLGTDNALTAAAYGMVALEDGLAERAYPRLFHATQAFQNAGFLHVELAHAALSSGDDVLAADWLGRGTPEGGGMRHDLARARLAHARGASDEALALLQDLRVRFPGDSQALYYLAEIARERAAMREAQRHFVELVTRWPHNVTYRAGLATTSLQLGDFKTYVRQLRWASLRAARSQNVLVGLTAGEFAKLIEIPRVAGLDRVRRWMSTRLGRRAKPVDVLQVVPGLLPRSGRVEDFEAGCIRAAMLSVATRPTLSAVAGPGFSAMDAAMQVVRVLHAFPQIAVLLPLGFRPTVIVGSKLVADHAWHFERLWMRVVQALAPDCSSPRLLVDHVVALIPDRDGDGKRERRGSREGIFEIVGSRTGEPLFRHAMEGFFLASADFDGDGISDLVFGDQGYDRFRGRVRVVNGATSEVLRVLEGEHESQRFGWTACIPGDLDGDGLSELLVGAPSNSAQSSGRAFVYSGGWLGKNVGSPQLAILRGDQGTGFGYRFVAMHDLDGDSVGDFAVAYEGVRAVTLYSGRSRAVLSRILLEGDGGVQALAVADLDADGVDDLLLSSTPPRRPGSAIAYSGAALALGRTKFLHRWNSADAGDAFGNAMLGLGDIDGDGHEDVAISGSQPWNFLQRGFIEAYSGRDGQRLWRVDGRPGQHLGTSLANLNDCDGDGVCDMVSAGVVISTRVR